VIEDDVEAAKWFRRAAEQGHRLAESCLGRIYATGIGVPQDYVEAYKWYNLAAVGYLPALQGRNRVAQQMTPDQIAEAQELSHEFKPRTILLHPQIQQLPAQDFLLRTMDFLSLVRTSLKAQQKFVWSQAQELFLPKW
jgi:hypothetical protein